MEASTDDRMVDLEVKVDRIEAILTRFEPMITELAFTTAKAAELQKLQIEFAEVKGRISSLPTWWMLMVTVLSTWTVGAGIVFTLVKASHS